MFRNRFLTSSLPLILVLTVRANADGPAAVKPEAFPKPAVNSPDEPLAKQWSLAKSGEFLDQASVTWTNQRKCGTCHTNYPYLMARPALGDASAPGLVMVRKFFEDRVAGWDKPEQGAKPRWDTEVVATAAALAFNDAQTTGKLHPLSRQALDRMWTLQRPNGAWNWLKCGWPPYEHDDYFGAVFAAVGVGTAPDRYAQSDSAQEGLAKLRRYLQKNAPPNLHHKAWLLWASLKLDGLMTPAERDQTIKDLMSLQQADGGWSLPSLGDWKGFDGRANDTKAPSDGYGTGFVIFILRQAGVPAKEAAIQRGIGWLKTHQRASGRWFTRSLNTDRNHFITHAGTAFAVMALTACDVKE
jgi:squalene-hopene/tetraprenyl-beta-curcumene cyclase